MTSRGAVKEVRVALLANRCQANLKQKRWPGTEGWPGNGRSWEAGFIGFRCFSDFSRVFGCFLLLPHDIHSEKSKEKQSLLLSRVHCDASGIVVLEESLRLEFCWIGV